MRKGRKIDRIVYMIINCINGKRYIGRDSYNAPSYLGGETVITQAVKKYGEKNFIKITLCKCASLTELIEREKYFIDLYDASNNPRCYNVSPDSDHSGLRLIDNRKPVHQYSIDKAFMCSYSSQDEAAYKYGVSKGIISNAVRGITKGACGYLWSHEKLDVFNPPISKQKRKYHNANTKPVYAYDEEGKYITEYMSIGEASEKLNVPHHYISQCVLRVRRAISKSYSLWFSYKKLEHIQVHKPGFSLLHRPVIQYSTNGSFIKEYESVNSAKRQTGAPYIFGVLCGNQRVSGGYIWKYKEVAV